MAGGSLLESYEADFKYAYHRFKCTERKKYLKFHEMLTLLFKLCLQGIIYGLNRIIKLYLNLTDLCGITKVYNIFL